MPEFIFISLFPSLFLFYFPLTHPVFLTLSAILSFLLFSFPLHSFPYAPHYYSFTFPSRNTSHTLFSSLSSYFSSFPFHSFAYLLLYFSFTFLSRILYFSHCLPLYLLLLLFFSSSFLFVFASLFLFYISVTRPVFFTLSPVLSLPTFHLFPFIPILFISC